jgi:hypothetical protein
MENISIRSILGRFRKSQAIFCELFMNCAMAAGMHKGSDALLGGWALEN